MDWFVWPREGEAGLVAIESNYGRKTEYAHFHGGKWMLDNSLKSPKILAWMPVPEFKEVIIPL